MNNNFTFKSISHERTYLQVLHKITEKIKNGQLKTGDKLPTERNMSEEYGVSRSTVREAIRAMELMGLVNSKQGDGNFISDNLSNALVEPLSLLIWIQDSSMQEILEFRKGIEKQAAVLASKKISKDELKKLDKLVKEIRRKGTPQEREIYSNLIHNFLGNVSGNSLIKSTVSSTITLMQRIKPNYLIDLFSDDIKSKKLLDLYDILLTAIYKRNEFVIKNTISQIMDLFYFDE